MNQGASYVEPSSRADGRRRQFLGPGPRWLDAWTSTMDLEHFLCEATWNRLPTPLRPIFFTFLQMNMGLVRVRCQGLFLLRIWSSFLLHLYQVCCSCDGY